VPLTTDDIPASPIGRWRIPFVMDADLRHVTHSRDGVDRALQLIARKYPAHTLASGEAVPFFNHKGDKFKVLFKCGDPCMYGPPVCGVVGFNIDGSQMPWGEHIFRTSWVLSFLNHTLDTDAVQDALSAKQANLWELLKEDRPVYRGACNSMYSFEDTKPRKPKGKPRPPKSPMVRVDVHVSVGVGSGMYGDSLCYTTMYDKT
jgi:hypothetical protein